LNLYSFAPGNFPPRPPDGDIQCGPLEGPPRVGSSEDKCGSWDRARLWCLAPVQLRGYKKSQTSPHRCLIKKSDSFCTAPQRTNSTREGAGQEEWGGSAEFSPLVQVRGQSQSSGQCWDWPLGNHDNTPHPPTPVLPGTVGIPTVRVPSTPSPNPKS
jgi:hypothetical protein